MDTEQALKDIMAITTFEVYLLDEEQKERLLPNNKAEISYNIDKKRHSLFTTQETIDNDILWARKQIISGFGIGLTV